MTTHHSSSRFLRHRSSSSGQVELNGITTDAETWTQQQHAMKELLVTSEVDDEASDVLPPDNDDEDRFESMSSSGDESSPSMTYVSSSSSSAEQEQDAPLLLLSKRGNRKGGVLVIHSPKPLHSQTKSHGSSWKRFQPSEKKEEPSFDVELYMAKREMTHTQERWNAITVLPNPAYCLYFLLTAQWLSSSAGAINVTTYSEENSWMMNAANQFFGADEHGCLNTNGSNWWHLMPALPPLPVLAVAVGICVHMPFSFMYHWTYAHALPPAARSKHWSRRMDQSMIHVCSAFLSYAVSGSWKFFLANVLYNADCFRRQFRPTVHPKRNQAHIFISIVAQTLPLLAQQQQQRDYDDDDDKSGGATYHHHEGIGTFVQLWVVFTISGWLFSQYPVGGWSHAVFHIVIALAPPILFQAAMQLSASAPQLSVAASCAAAAKLRNEMNSDF